MATLHLTIDVANMTGLAVRLKTDGRPDTPLESRGYERLELDGNTDLRAVFDADAHAAPRMDLFFRNAGVRTARLTLSPGTGTPETCDLTPGESRRLGGKAPLDVRIEPAGQALAS